MANKNLSAARVAKNDEFYTQEKDIAAELNHYRGQFEGKVVYCNCDNYHWSNFYKIFKNNFNTFGLKKLIASCFNPDRFGEYVIYDGYTEVTGNSWSNGSFDDPDNLKRLEEADIVVTNPPFSLFRKFVETLEKYNKKYLLIGNMNAITYKEVFKLIKANKFKLGYNMVKEFIQPDGTIKKFGNIMWFTNLDVDVKWKIARAKENLDVTDEFYAFKYYGHEEDYPKYDNYDAINVNKVSHIPNDYFGEIGVPITFMDYYDPNVWEIVALTNGSSLFDPSNKEIYWNVDSTKFCTMPIINGQKVYIRLIIKRK